MDPIVSVAQMRTLEAAADANGVTYAAMMQQAGVALANAIFDRLGDVQGLTVLVLVGSGNNGGDGLVAAVALAEHGAIPKCYFLRPPDEENPQVQAARTAGLFVADFESDSQQRVLKHLANSADVVIDALFGTGLRLPLPANAASLLRTVKARLNAHPNPPLLVAADCPTGMDCDTGAVDPHTLTCDFTITFGAFKLGHFAFPAADYTGGVHLAEIGWPDDLPGLAEIQCHVPDPADIAKWLPERPFNSHKGTYGRALAVAGSIHYTGAAYLAAAAAYRSGAGLVTLATPPELHPALAGQLPEATWLLLAADLGLIAGDAAEQVRIALPNYQAVLFGPGLGTQKPTAEFLARLLATPKRSMGLLEQAAATPPNTDFPPTVIDAGGLRLLAALPDWPSRLPSPAILTPHPGEMAALTGLSTEEIQADRVGVAQRFAAEWGHVVVLKGAFTVIASPTGETAVLPFATSALATAGTGDVLAGMCLGFLAQGLAHYPAAICAAYLHALAGDLAAEELGSPASVMASDVLDCIAGAFTEIQ